jgi:antitoxin component of RelBE/YafQ-DinJ toxin-antitoxin module
VCELARTAQEGDGRISIRLTGEEQAALLALCANENVTPSEAVRVLIREKVGLSLPVSEPDRELLKAADEHFRRVGINLNQAVRAMNQGRVEYQAPLEAGLKSLIGGLVQMRLEISRLVKPVRKPRGSHAV